MVVTVLLTLGGYYLYLRFIKDDGYVKYKKLLDHLEVINKDFKISENIKLISYTKEDDTDIIVVDISGVLGFEELKNRKDFLSTYFKKEILDIIKLKDFNVKIILK